MWRLLTWCNKHHITLRAKHVPGSLNVIVDGLSRRNQIQHTKWSLSPQIFKQLNYTSKGNSTYRPVRHQSKQETYHLCVAHPRPSGMGGRHNKHLEEPGRLRLSSFSSLTQSGSETVIIILLAKKMWFWDLVELSLDHLRQLPPIH